MASKKTIYVTVQVTIDKEEICRKNFFNALFKGHTSLAPGNIILENVCNAINKNLGENFSSYYDASPDINPVSENDKNLIVNVTNEYTVNEDFDLDGVSKEGISDSINCEYIKEVNDVEISTERELSAYELEGLDRLADLVKQWDMR